MIPQIQQQFGFPGLTPRPHTPGAATSEDFGPSMLGEKPSLEEPPPDPLAMAVPPDLAPGVPAITVPIQPGPAIAHNLTATGAVAPTEAPQPSPPPSVVVAPSQVLPESPELAGAPASMAVPAAQAVTPPDLASSAPVILAATDGGLLSAPSSPVAPRIAAGPLAKKPNLSSVSLAATPVQASSPDLETADPVPLGVSAMSPRPADPAGVPNQAAPPATAPEAPPATVAPAARSSAESAWHARWQIPPSAPAQSDDASHADRHESRLPVQALAFAAVAPRSNAIAADAACGIPVSLAVDSLAGQAASTIDARRIVPDSVALAAPAPQAAPGLALPAAVPAQLLHLAPAAKAGPVELILSPEELGRVKFQIHQQGDTVRVVLSVERPETLDLIRRHGDQLLQEFRQAGFSGATLSFGQWGQQNHAPPSAAPAIADEDSCDATPAPPRPAVLATALPIGQGLDLRL